MPTPCFLVRLRYATESAQVLPTLRYSVPLAETLDFLINGYKMILRVKDFPKGVCQRSLSPRSTLHAFWRVPLTFGVHTSRTFIVLNRRSFKHACFVTFCTQSFGRIGNCRSVPDKGHRRCPQKGRPAYRHRRCNS